MSSFVEVVGAPPEIASFRRSLFLGDALFETILVRNARPFRLDAHLDRMRAGALRLGITAPADLSDQAVRLCERARESALPRAALRILLARAGALGLNPPDGESVLLLEVTPSDAADTPAPLSAIVASARRNERAATVGLKLPAFHEAILALREARARNAVEAIFLDSRDRVAEASASNVFVCTRGVLATPAEQCGILAGVTRAAVLELATQLGISSEVRIIGAEELRRADEIFLTSTLRGIATVSVLDGATVGGGQKTVTTRIRDAYEALVARECAS